MVSVPQHDASFDLYSSPNVSIAVKTTNHVSNPLPSQSNNPFTSPLVTLSESLGDPGQTYITAHDLIEAYNVMSLRLRTLMQAKVAPESGNQPLEALGIHSDCIEQCLSRDIRRLLPNPFDTQTSYPQSYLSQENPEDDFQRITNNVLLCHYALRLIADIFAFPVVHVHFADSQLALLLEDVVSICTTPTPVPNLKKLCFMIMLLLKSQQLPASVLSSCETHITTALKSVIVDKSGGPQAQVDAFQALHHILSRNPTFFDSFLELLPHVLESLNTQPVKGKPLTTLALCGFAMAKLKLLESHTTNFNGAQAYEITSTYIDEQGSRRPSLQKNKNRNKQQQQPLLLPALFKEAFTSTESTWKAFGPAFGVAVAASLIVLMDHALFSSSRALKLIFEVIKHTTARGSLKPVRAMHPELWRCLIWAYGRLPSPQDHDHDRSMEVQDGGGGGDESNNNSQLSELADLRDRAFEIVMQDLRNGTGLALLEVLLNRNRNNKEIGKAVDVVSRLVKADDSALRDEGLRVMDWLLSHIGADSNANSPSRRVPGTINSDPHSLPFSLSLLDGAILFQGTRKLSLAHPSRTVLEQIPPLSEEDVAGNWACLCEAWICAARNSVLATGGEVQVSFSPHFDSRVYLLSMTFRIWPTFLRQVCTVLAEKVTRRLVSAMHYLIILFRRAPLHARAYVPPVSAVCGLRYETYHPE